MSRASIVGMLIAAELLIVGIAIYTVGPAGWSRDWPGERPVDFSASAISPIDAGTAPHVVIDDADSRVVLTPSGDALVHVRDLTQAHGLLFGTPIRQLSVKQVSDGVRIERPASPGGGLHIGVIGFVRERIAVAVPPGSRVEIAHCSGADVSGINGGVSVNSDDGSIRLANASGSIRAVSGDGSIEATNVKSDTLDVRASDGHVTLRNVAAVSLTAHTGDGHVDAVGLAITGNGANEISTNDGSIRLAFAPDASMTIDASTGDGDVVVDGTRYSGDDSAQRSVRVGSGAASVKISSGDGSIHLSTNGAL